MVAAARVPIFVKLAPDLGEDALEEALAVCVEAGASGLIATNTTLARDGLAAADQQLGQRGGRAVRGAADDADPRRW